MVYEQGPRPKIFIGSTFSISFLCVFGRSQVYFLIGKLFKTSIDKELVSVRWALLSRFFPDYFYRIN